jgi:hypothetical protein
MVPPLLAEEEGPPIEKEVPHVSTTRTGPPAATLGGFQYR